MRESTALWNHWFWITAIIATQIVHSSGDSLQVEPQKNMISFPISQVVEEVDPNKFVSQSVSVSKVSVKMGEVRDREGRNLVGHSLNSEDARFYSEPTFNTGGNYLSPVDLPIVNPRVAQQPHQLPQAPVSFHDSFLAQLLEQLSAVANVTVSDNPFPAYNDIGLPATAAEYADDAEYQLVYKDDYLSDYDLDHMSDDYLNYLYEIYDDLGADLTYYDDVIDTIDNVNDVVEAVVKVEEVNNNLAEAFSRSEAVNGRALDEDPEEEVIEIAVESVAPASEEIVNKLEYVDKSIEEVNEEATEHTIEDLVVQQVTASNYDDTDFYIKIAIFICVSIAVLVVSGGLLFVMLRRKIKKVGETVLVTNEDEMNNQVVFQTQLKQTSSLQDHIFSNHFGKSAYLYDDLHSLDNDSFLTSLETISEKDRFDFE